MYKLTLDEQDQETISFVGNRYYWSESLSKRIRVWGRETKDGKIVMELPEAISWDLKSDFEKDTEGGHLLFPMLDYRSDLARKLFAFMDGIV